MMRYFLSIIIAIMLLGDAQEAKGQYYDQAIGFRAGTSFELSYKRFLFYNPRYFQQAGEVLIGYHIDEWDKRYNGFVLEALYHFHLDIGFDTGWSAFLGLGGYAGVYTEPSKQPYFGGGVTLALGIAYNFTHVPISISLDWKPLFGFPRLPPKSLARGAITLRYILPTTWQ
jgi:hypothetical protein